MLIWNVLPIFAALVGGVGAVILGQFLSLYREEIDAAREIRYQLDYINLVIDGELSISETARASEKMKVGLEEISRKNMWLFSEKGKTDLMELIFALNKLEYAASEGNTEEIDTYCDLISDICDSLDDEIAYVTLWGALKRFFGDERPYDDYGTLEK